MPEDKGGSSPGDLIQKAKASMRDSPFGLADFALPTLGALGSVALNDAHNWSCESLTFVTWDACTPRGEVTQCGRGVWLRWSGCCMSCCCREL